MSNKRETEKCSHCEGEGTSIMFNSERDTRGPGFLRTKEEKALCWRCGGSGELYKETQEDRDRIKRLPWINYGD